MAMCWRLFISSMIILDVLCGIETVCVPAPFNAGLRGFPCLNQPMALAADTLGVQISTNLGIGADCGENKFELYNSNVGVINTDPGDIYEYDIYWDQPNTQCLVDLYYYNATGGKLLREFLNLLADQNGISNHPLDAALVDSGYAYRKWYTRRFVLPDDFSGSSVLIQLVCNSNTAGPKLAYFRRVNIKAPDGTVKHVFYDPQTTPDECVGQYNNCASGCKGVCRVQEPCTCSDPFSYETCLASQTCTVAPSCSCDLGFIGALCDQPVCSNGCSFGYVCVAPETCGCDTTIVGSCGQTETCQPPKPSDDALCRIVDGISQWVVNSTLTVNGTVAFNESVVIVGDFIVVNGTEVTLNSGSTITVLGCPQIDGSLALELTQEEINDLIEDGTLNRTALVNEATCADGTEFNQVVIKNSQECILYEATQQKYPGVLTILVQDTKLSCDNEQPESGTELPDWGIAVIVVGAVLIAAAATTAGLVVRHQKLKKEMEKYDKK